MSVFNNQIEELTSSAQISIDSKIEQIKAEQEYLNNIKKLAILKMEDFLNNASKNVKVDSISAYKLSIFRINEYEKQFGSNFKIKIKLNKPYSELVCKNIVCTVTGKPANYKNFSAIGVDYDFVKGKYKGLIQELIVDIQL